MRPRWKWWRHGNWRTLLFEPGRGWLRWGWGAVAYQYIIDPEIGGPVEWEGCAPPLRRLWHMAQQRSLAPWDLADEHWPDDYMVLG